MVYLIDWFNNEGLNFMIYSYPQSLTYLLGDPLSLPHSTYALTRAVNAANLVVLIFLKKKNCVCFLPVNFGHDSYLQSLTKFISGCQEN